MGHRHRCATTATATVPAASTHAAPPPAEARCMPCVCIRVCTACSHVTGQASAATSRPQPPPPGVHPEPHPCHAGLTATPEVAQETHAYVRSWFKENYSDAVAENVVIQYGGSVNAENVDELMACPDIDGALVGGASLKGESFSAICNFKQK